MAILVVLAVLVTCAAATTDGNPTDNATGDDAGDMGTIIETAESAGQFGTLLEVLDAAGLTEELNSGGPYTVFAPTDDAFAVIPSETLDALLADPQGDLTTILTYHVVAGEYRAEDLAGLESVDTLAGVPLTITVEGDTIMVDGAQVIATDTMASNGVIHVIDAVMVPEGVELPAAEEPAEEPAENVTEEATEEPVEEMTEAPMEEPAENVTEEATEEPVEEMTEAPVVAPPEEEEMPVEEEPNVVDCAAAEGNFTTLVTLLELTGLNETLSDPALNVTVFAPTDEAFALLPGPVVDLLVNNTAARGLLEEVLLYHVVNGTYMAADLEGVSNLTALQNETLAINVTDGNVTVNQANVTAADIQCSNGIIHVVDGVLLSSQVPNMTITETAAAEGNFTTLSTALNLTGLNATLNEPGPFTVFAPNDEAFAALPEGALEDLVNDTPALENVLLYHVVPGWYLAANFENVTTLQTVQGANLTFTSTDGNLTVNGANVTVADIHAINGEIHVIDAVLVPPENETELAPPENETPENESEMAP
ncbi:MAG: fasciclin domain-containing protein [Methanomicrobiaceae archaeon]|nr:fasciclin domain-containing protein [Methanomicrobiaceae archaeon]